MTEIKYNELMFIESDKIIIENNIRKKFDSKDITELAESIASVGLINPITVCENPNDEDTFLLVAGERRFRACKQLDMNTIPVILVEGDENELRQLQLVENCQRKNIGPVEELEVFAELISKEYTPQNIADSIGKSIRYVNTRLNLIKLTDRAKMLLYNEELNLSQCKYLLVMSEKLQDKALDELIYTDGLDNIKFKPAESFRKFYVSNETKSLKHAYFEPMDENLDDRVGSCTKCSFNSAVNTVLFSEMSIDGFCAKPKCFNNKTQLTIYDKIEEFIESGFNVVKVSEHYDDKMQCIANYTKATETLLFEHDMNAELMLIVTKGYHKVGDNYPVFTERQLKKVKKSTEKKVEKNPAETKDNKSLEAIIRYTKLITSKIAQNLMQNDILFSSGVVLTSMWKMYSELDKTQQSTFIELITGETLSNIEMGKNGENGFFSNIQIIEENLEYAFSILTVINLDEKYVYSDSIQHVLIQKLASEADVNIEECKKEIQDESGIDLSKV